VSGVTTEEVEREREYAHRIYGDIPCIYASPDHGLICTRIATALAVRAREARREALGEALGMMMRTAEQHRIDGWDVVADVLYRLGAAIRALMGPET
jgi:hypothetical protein